MPPKTDWPDRLCTQLAQARSEHFLKSIIYIYTRTHTHTHTQSDICTHTYSPDISTNQTALREWYEFASTSFNLSSCCAFLLLVLLVKRLQIGSYIYRYLIYSIFGILSSFISFSFSSEIIKICPSDFLQLDSQTPKSPIFPSPIILWITIIE